MVFRHALVFSVIMAHLRTVDPNAQSIRIVPAIRHACVTNVKIHALVPVVKVRIVMWSIITLSVRASMVTQEIHSAVVDQYLHRRHVIETNKTSLAIILLHIWYYFSTRAYPSWSLPSLTVRSQFSVQWWSLYMSDRISWRPLFWLSPWVCVELWLFQRQSLPP